MHRVDKNCVAVGEQPTYCDFQLTMMLNLMKAKAIDKLEALGSVADLLAPFEKATAVHKAIMALPSAEKLIRTGRSTLPDFYFNSTDWNSLPSY